jgi:hypothetical protein
MTTPATVLSAHDLVEVSPGKWAQAGDPAGWGPDLDNSATPIVVEGNVVTIDNGNCAQRVVDIFNELTALGCEVRLAYKCL